MEMLNERDTALCARVDSTSTFRRPSYFFNSFFMERLLMTNNKYSYGNVKRWTKFAVFEQDKIVFPINIKNAHWTMAVIYIQRKEIHYYDSMSGSGKKWLDGLLNWLVDETKGKKGQGQNKLDTREWRLVDCEPTVPQQNNGLDCGVFAMMCADFISDDLPLDYTQENIPFFRRKIAADIIRGSLLYTCCLR